MLYYRVLFLQKVGATNFTERYRIANPPGRDLVDANATLIDLRIWYQNVTGLPSHDHVMLMTG